MVTLCEFRVFVVYVLSMLVNDESAGI